MKQPTPEYWPRTVNAAVAAYLEEKSAHSDIAGLLRDAVRPLGDVHGYCPDPGSYRFLSVATNGVVFGFAVGQSLIAFRLDPRMRERALATGGGTLPECGPDWVAVLQPRADDDWPAVDLRFWARKAYAAARGG